MKPTTIAMIFILLMAIVGVGLAEDLQWVEATASANWSGRSEHATCVFDGKLWVIGGINTTGYLNDVWSSTDGVNWICKNYSAGFLPRGQHAVVAMGSYMYLIGGTNNSATLISTQLKQISMSDVWKSSDGIAWTLVNASPSWSYIQNGTRTGLCAFGSNNGGDGNTIYITGGYRCTELYYGYSEHIIVSSDIYSSTDGNIWTDVGDLPVGPETPSGGWSISNDWFGHQSPWMSTTLIGGQNTQYSSGPYHYAIFPAYGTVYSTYLGSPWTTRTITGAWTPRIYHSSIYYNSKLYLMGGYSSDSLFKNDVWYSSDEGVTWSQYSAANWSIRQFPQAQVFNSKIYIAGGYSSAEGYHNDVWYGEINSTAIAPGQSTTGGAGIQYPPHNVKFLVKDRYGNGITGLTVTATSQETTMGSWDWLTSLFGLSTATNIAGSTLTGHTGGDGAISFVMMETIGYNLHFTNTTTGINYTTMIYPQESEILINIKDYPTVIHPQSDYVSFNITEYTNVNNSITLKSYFQDNSSTTTSATFWVKFQNGTSVYSSTKINPTSEWFQYLLPYKINTTYVYGLTTTSSVYPSSNTTKVHAFPTLVDLEIPSEYYSWISAAILLLFCAIFSRGNNIFGVIIIPAVASFLVYIGWLPIAMGATVTILLVLGVLLYMKARSVD